MCQALESLIVDSGWGACKCVEFWCVAQRSPPLRRGSKVTNPRTRADTAHARLSVRSADPGMVIAFDKASTSPSLFLSITIRAPQHRNVSLSNFISCHVADFRACLGRRISPVQLCEWSCYNFIGIACMQAADPAAKPQLDLLNFEDLSIDPASSSPMPAATPSSNGTPAKPTNSTDYLSRCCAPSAALHFQPHW